MYSENQKPSRDVISPMPRGSGAILVHNMLEQFVPGYRVTAYNPWWTLFPPAINLFSGLRPYLIHTSADYAFFSGRPGCPVVITFHNYVLDAFMRKFSSRMQWLHYRTDLRAFTKLALRYADVVTAVSESTAILVREDLGYKGMITVIPNGVDINRFCLKSSAPRVKPGFSIMFSGKLTQRKGAQLLPAIAARLGADQYIVCVGKQAASLVRFPNKNILFLGALQHERMPEIYSSCDVLLMPTIREGMSLAALEAMACGLPIVATDCPSMRELLVDGKSGFLCPLGDAAAFAQRLVWLCEHPNVRVEMGSFNRRRAALLHDSSLMAQRYQALFNELPS